MYAYENLNLARKVASADAVAGKVCVISRVISRVIAGFLLRDSKITARFKSGIHFHSQSTTNWNVNVYMNEAVVGGVRKKGSTRVR